MGGSVKVESQLGVGTEFKINVNTICKQRKVNMDNIMANDFGP